MIYYREGYKYQLALPYVVQTPIKPWRRIEHEFFALTQEGLLTIKAGYAWDGASGPTIDTKSSMRAALVHDCFCQLLRNRDLDYDSQAAAVHQFFYDLLREDGMWAWRAKLWHAAVVLARGGHPDNEDSNPLMHAP